MQTTQLLTLTSLFKTSLLHFSTICIHPSKAVKFLLQYLDVYKLVPKMPRIPNLSRISHTTSVSL